MSGQISCGFEILVKLGVWIKKIKNTLLVGFYKNQSKSPLLEKKIGRISLLNEPRSNILGIHL